MSDGQGDRARAILEALFGDLAEQCRSATRTAAEGRGDVREKLLVHMEMAFRAARSAAERVAALEPAAPDSVRQKAEALIEEHRAFEAQTVSAKIHLTELAEGWKCKRCGLTIASSAKLAPPPDVGVPVLECRACSAETPVTAQGKAAFERLFAHLLKGPAWNPAVNGFSVSRR